MSELPQQTEKLIRVLQEQTQKGRRSWEKGSADTEFAFVHDAGSVVILSVSGDGGAPFELRILDPEGEVAEKFDSNAAGAEILGDLYRAARASSTSPSRVVKALLEEINRSPGAEVEERMPSAVEQVKATQNKGQKAEILKPLLLKRVEDLLEKDQTTLQWPELIAPFPTGGGVHNALPKAFRALRESGDVKCSVDPEPGPNQGFGGGKVIRLKAN